MAASSKPTGVHYALVVFVLISIVCGLGWLLAYKGANSISELRGQLATLQKDRDASKKAADGYYEDIKRINDKLGTKFESVGTDDSNPGTTLGALAILMRNYNKGGADSTLTGAMSKQENFLLGLQTERDELQKQLATERDLHRQEQERLNGALAAEKASRDASDKRVVDADNQHKEEQKKKDEDIAQYKRALKNKSRRPPNSKTRRKRRSRTSKTGSWL